MSKTYRQQGSRFDDDRRQGRGGKHHRHSNNRKYHGMQISGAIVDEYFNVDRKISTTDDIYDTNKNSDEEL